MTPTSIVAARVTVRKLRRIAHSTSEAVTSLLPCRGTSRFARRLGNEAVDVVVEVRIVSVFEVEFDVREVALDCLALLRTAFWLHISVVVVVCGAFKFVVWASFFIVTPTPVVVVPWSWLSTVMEGSFIVWFTVVVAVVVVVVPQCRPSVSSAIHSK